MGGDLKSEHAKAPTFIVWAVKDPTSGNLDRIQIIKGRTKSGQSFEKIFDVVWSGDRKPDEWTGRVGSVGNTVDLVNATYTNTIGATELKTVWTDPEFDPSLHAFYYARALEIPTPRWTTIQAHQFGVPIADTVPATVQERAWSSPIWYTPSEEERKKAKPGTSVADLLKNGGVALNDAQLKALVIGKALWVRNTVTEGIFKVVYDKAGQSVIYHVGRYAVLPSEVGNVYQAGYQGISSGYTIQNGKIVTTVADSPFEVTVYNVGDKHLVARSNEFGFVNYELMAQPPNNLVETGKEVHTPPEADKGLQ